ncbi:hypothetical protein Droror1_Dr00023308 [Drosera rotundifolia]
MSIPENNHDSNARSRKKKKIGIKLKTNLREIGAVDFAVGFVRCGGGGGGSGAWVKRADGVEAAAGFPGSLPKSIPGAALSEGVVGGFPRRCQRVSSRSTLPVFVNVRRNETREAAGFPGSLPKSIPGAALSEGVVGGFPGRCQRVSSRSTLPVFVNV